MVLFFTNKTYSVELCLNFSHLKFENFQTISDGETTKILILLAKDEEQN